MSPEATIGHPAVEQPAAALPKLTLTAVPRALWRSVGAAGAVLVAWLGLIANAAWNARRPERFREVRNRIFRRWALRMTRVLGIEVRVDGRPPEPPFYLVANHLSYLDIIVLATAVDAVFVSKAEVRNWPLMGRICAAAGTIFLNRGHRKDLVRVQREMRHWRGMGYGLIVFPEGTSSAGFEVRPFKSSLLELAVSDAIPVHAAAISYRTPPQAPPAHLTACWWGDTPFFPHLVRLLHLDGLEASLCFGEQPIQDADRKALASRLHAAVRERFVPVVSGRYHAG